MLFAGLIGGMVIAVEEESFTLFMYFAIGSFLSFLFIYGIGEIIGLLTDIQGGRNGNVEKTSYETTEQMIKNGIAWQCSQCKGLNAKNAPKCTWCGFDKPNLK